MPESVYKVIELVGTSTQSWEKAAAAAVERASKTLRDLRVAEVVQLDMALTSDHELKTPIRRPAHINRTPISNPL
jgi:flavin-binding protein dodecin